MDFKPIDPELLAALTRPKVKAAPIRTEVDDYEYPESFHVWGEWNIPMQDCDCCGHCFEPTKCVWSVTCPKCEAAPRTHCRQGTRIVALHQERWTASRGTYRYQELEDKMLLQRLGLIPSQ